MKRYVLAQAFDRENLPAGTVVYACQLCDYGLSSDDTRMTGIEHTNVTLREDGGYPAFTIPRHLLREEPQP